MAIQGISYRSCSSGATRYLGLDDSNGNIVGHPTDGPDIGGDPIEDDDYNFSASCKIAGKLLYSDANWEVYSDSSYPYATVEDLNNPTPPPDPPPQVCDLSLNIASITDASGVDASDGSFTINATAPTASTETKFKIGSDFTYSSEGFGGSYSGGIWSYTFTGLLSGVYTIYARNTSSCMRTINVEIGVADRHSPIYRLDFDDLVDGRIYDSQKYRFDILERDYSGAVTEVKGGSSSPIVISWEGKGEEDPFNPIIPSRLTATLLSDTHQKFIDLYSGDDRKYLGKFYEYNGSTYDLKWSGYLATMLYSEPYYSKTNYPVTFVFTDLGSLSGQPFGPPVTNILNPVTFKGRLSLLNGIILCLRKTGLSLNIYESANLYTSTMDSSDNDSMLTQTGFDVDTYIDNEGVPQDCLSVLESLLTNIGCRIYQAEGRWNIELVTQKVATDVLTREYNYNSVRQNTYTLNPRLLSRISDAVNPKVTFRDRSQQMKVAEQYGVINIIHELDIEEENNILVRGNFNPEDITNGQFTGWSLTKSGTPTAAIEILTEERGGADSALVIDFSNQYMGTYVDLTASPVYLYAYNGTFKLSFDVLVRSTYKDTYAFIDYAWTFGDDTLILEPGDKGELKGAATGTGWVNGIYNRVFIDNMLSWKTIETTIPLSVAQDWASSLTGNMRLRIRAYGNSRYDLDSLTTLKALAVDYNSPQGRTNVNQYAKVRVAGTQAGKPVIRFYSFEAAGGATSSEPETVIPDAGNTYGYWKLNKTVYDTGENNWIQQILFTNVKVSYLPGGNNPLDSVASTETVQPNIKRYLKREIENGDIYTAFSIDDNYRYLTTRWFSYMSSGSPTSGGWFRRGVTEDLRLTQVLAKMYKGQLGVPRWKLTGTYIPYGCQLSLYNTIQEINTGRVYLPTSLEVDYVQKRYNIEMIEALIGEPVEDEGEPTIPPVEPPVETREHSGEFSSEFS